MDKSKVTAYHNSIIEKLTSSIEGTVDFKEGQIVNPLAPCLIRSAIGDVILMQAEINK